MASTAATAVPVVSEVKQPYVLTEEKEKQPIETIWREMLGDPFPRGLTIDDLYNITRFFERVASKPIFTGKKILVGMHRIYDLDTIPTLVEALIKLPRKKEESTPDHNEFEYYLLEDPDINDMNDGNLTEAEVEILKSETKPFLDYYKSKSEN